MIESAYPGSCNVSHVKAKPFNGQRIYNGHTEVWEAQPGYLPEIPKPSLEWETLPTSNTAGLIQILAEMDQTVAMFGLRFWQSLNYGAVNWGILPLISDLKSILRILSNLETNLRDFAYETSTKEDHQFSWYNVYGDHFYGNQYCTYHYAGRGDLGGGREAQILLDRLGFMPDIATAWDLIPFSFVVDYIFPIGDYLESFRAGGWVRSFTFHGWLSCTRVVKGTWAAYEASPVPVAAEYKYRTYDRWAVSDYFLSTSTEVKEPLLRIPSFRQMFNIWWLFNEARRSRR